LEGGESSEIGVPGCHIDLVRQVVEALLVRSPGRRVDHRAEVAAGCGSGRSAGGLNQVEHMDVPPGPGQQHGEITHAFGVDHGHGPASEVQPPHGARPDEGCPAGLHRGRVTQVVRETGQ
jgi:hypothetical protein